MEMQKQLKVHAFTDEAAEDMDGQLRRPSEQAQARADAGRYSGRELGELKRKVWMIRNWYRTQHSYDSGSSGDRQKSGQADPGKWRAEVVADARARTTDPF